jgi:hypothetical protein
LMELAAREKDPLIAAAEIAEAEDAAHRRSKGAVEVDLVTPRSVSHFAPEIQPLAPAPEPRSTGGSGFAPVGARG